MGQIRVIISPFHLHHLCVFFNSMYISTNSMQFVSSVFLFNLFIPVYIGLKLNLISIHNLLLDYCFHQFHLARSCYPSIPFGCVHVYICSVSTLYNYFIIISKFFCRWQAQVHELVPGLKQMRLLWDVIWSALYLKNHLLYQVTLGF